MKRARTALRVIWATCWPLSALLACDGAYAAATVEGHDVGASSGLIISAPEPQAIVTAAQQGEGSRVRELIRANANVNALGPDGSSALHWVAHRQDLETARALIRAGANVNQANKLGITPLWVAIDNDDRAMVKQLLAARANANAVDSTGLSCLMMAAGGGDGEIVRSLLASGAGVEQRDPEYQQTALMFAARGRHAAIVKMLLAHGAQVDNVTRTGKVPAFRTAASNAGSKGAGIIRGGWPERGERDPTPGAKTALLYAAREGDVPTVEALLKAGAAIEKADADGVTPLLMALENDQLDVAQFLISKGANVKAADWYGQTPLFAAVDVRDLDIAGPHQSNGVDRGKALELIQKIIDRGADVNARTKEYPPQRRWITRLGSLSWVDFTGQTPFLRAALSGDVEVMQLLLEHRADPNIKAYNGTTALMAAAGVNWTVAQTYDEGPAQLLAAVELAQSVGNDVNAVNAMGLTAIHGAANRGSDDIIRFLAAHGAKLDVADKQGRTPLIWAQGVFLATHPPEAKPKTVALLNQLKNGAS